MTGAAYDALAQDTPAPASVLSALDDFRLGEYVAGVRAHGRMALDERTRVHAAALYRRVREARVLTGPTGEGAELLAFAEAVLEPQRAMQLPGGKRYRTYTNGRVLDWVLNQTAACEGEQGLLPACGWTIHRKVLGWRAYESATLDGLSTWNQSRVDPVQVARRVRLLDKLVALCRGVSWWTTRDHVPPQTAERSWCEYAAEPAGDLALEFLTTLPQTTEHDEVSFLNCIHVGECSFVALKTCLKSALGAVQRGDLPGAEAELRCARHFADAFDLSFKALAVMPQEHFLRFVAATGQASAVQSRAYQEVQVLMYGPLPGPRSAWDHFPETAGLGEASGSSLAEALVPLGDSAEARAVVEAARSLDSALYRWRARHYGASRRLYPFSGLELGSGYLEGHYGHKLNGHSAPREGDPHR